MKQLLFRPVILIAFLIALFFNVQSFAQANKEFSKEQAVKWYTGWAQAHKDIKVDQATLDVQEFAKQYNAHPTWWDEALAYLKRPDLANLPLGRFQIDSDKVTDVVSVGPSKEYSNTKWESHKAYADIHYLITGGEMVAAGSITTATVTKPFAPGSDSAAYTADGKIYAYPPGGVFILFPHQIHQPGIKAPGSDNYKKIVMKVKVI